MGKALYSASHDRTLSEPSSNTASKAEAMEDINEGEVLFSQSQLSPEQRKQLRERQLEAAGKLTARGPDSWRRQKKIPKGRGGQGLPTVNVPGSDTLAKPPDFSKRGVNVILGDPDLEDPRLEIEKKVRWRRTHKHKRGMKKGSALPRLAAGISALDDSLSSVNRDVIDIDTTLNNLLASAKELEARAVKSQDPQLSNAAQMIRSITERALIGWIEVIKDYLKDVLGETDEAEQLQNQSQLPAETEDQTNQTPPQGLPQQQPQLGIAANRRRYR